MEDKIKETKENIKLCEEGILLNDENLEYHRWNKCAHEKFLRLLEQLNQELVPYTYVCNECCTQLEIPCFVNGKCPECGSGSKKILYLRRTIK